MRTRWFAKTAVPHPMATPEDKKKQELEMVEKAEALLTHVAETYLEKATPSSTTLVPSTHTNATSESMPVKSSSFMDDACVVKVVGVQVSETTSTPLELLADEIKHYTEFQGGKGDLQKPLAWWKASPAPRYAKSIC